jgi:hypothetical protein
MTVEKARLAFMEKMKTYPLCSFINRKGVQCKYRCPNFIPTDEQQIAMCSMHKDSIIYKRCLFVEYDSEGKAYECPCYHRTTTDFCGTHNAKIANRKNSVEFYKKNKDIIILKRKQAKGLDHD